MKKIIDVSYAQGKIYWDKVKKDGIDGAIIRCGYGRGNIDEWAQKNIDGALNAGLLVGVYWFSYAYTEDMAKREARYCNDVANAWKDKLTLGMYFDFEGDSMNWMRKKGVAPSKGFVTELFVAFCKEAASLGYKAGYYLNPDYAKNWVDESKLKAYRRWLAWWTSKEQRDCYIWQYTDKGIVAGINGRVDMDILYDDTQPTPTPQKTVDELAKEVLEGKWGNGKERETLLGDRYDEVQARVNELLKSDKKYYTIQPGDTLFNIAVRNKTTVNALVALNNIKNPNRIYAGDTIRIR